MTDMKKIAMDAAVECARMLTASSHAPAFVADAYRTICAAMLKADGERKVVIAADPAGPMHRPPEYFGGRVIGRIDYTGSGAFEVRVWFPSQSSAANFLDNRICTQP